MNPRQSWILYSKLSISGFWIPIVNGIRLLDCITNSKAKDSGFCKQHFPGRFKIPQTIISGIQDSTSKNFPDTGIPYMWGKNCDEKHCGCRILKEYYWLFFFLCWGIVRYAVQGDPYLPVFSSRRWLYHMMAFPFSGLTIKLLWWQFLARLHFQFSPLVHA